jgi:hypothetical protein
MSEQQPEQEKEPLKVEKNESGGIPLLRDKSLVDKSLLDKYPVDKYPQEWIPGEQLELIRIPPPTIWPATLALGVTGMAFGVVTHWILSAAGLFLFLLGAAGWIEDLKKDVL